MSEFEITSLEFNGYGGAPVANHYFRPAVSSQVPTLAIILPGLSYSGDMPLLYYTRLLLLQRGADVLQLDTSYASPNFQKATRQEQAMWLGADATAAVKAGRAAQPDHAASMPQRLILAGKSIGTVALAYLVSSSEPDATTVWLTPLLRQPLIVQAVLQCNGPTMCIAGTGDATFEAAALESIQAAGAEVMIIEGANHSLEIPGDIFQSLKNLNTVVQGLAGFLDRQGGWK